MNSTPSAQAAAASLPPPQDSRVALSRGRDSESASGGSDAGRFAVAAVDIAPGDVVLAALPYLFVFNPSEFCSGLYLAARAVPAEQGVTGGGAAKRKGGVAGPRSCVPIAPAAHDEKEAQHATHEATTAVLTQSHSTRCSGCFRELPPGTVMANVAAIKELAVDISAEQEAVQDVLLRQQLGGWAAGQAGEVDEDEEDETSPESAPGGKKKKKKKPPTRGAKKMKSNAAMELRNRMAEQAAAQREGILHEHRMRKQQRKLATQKAAPGEVPESSSSHEPPSCWRDLDALSNAAHGMAVCEGCGVMAYCSPRCWTEGHARHVESGECGALRWVYPLMMREYYALSCSATAGAAGGTAGGSGGHGKDVPATSVVMPGEEPLQWARNANEAKSLEAQCMLLVSLLLAACGREQTAVRGGTPATAKGGAEVEEEESFGTVAHWGLTQARVEGSEERQHAHKAITLHERQQEVEDSVGAEVPHKADDVAHGADEPTLSPSSSPPSPPPAGQQGPRNGRPALSQSQQIPSSVRAMQDSRIRLGLAGRAEVMDADAAQLEEVSLRGSTEAGALCAEASRRCRILCRSEQDDARHCLCITASLSSDDADPACHACTRGEAPQPRCPVAATPDCDAHELAGGTGGREAGVVGALPPQRLRVPCYADQAAMVTNLCVLSRERRGLYARYYRRFVKVFLPWLAAVTAYEHHRRMTDVQGGHDAVPLFPEESNGQRYLLRHAAALLSTCRGEPATATEAPNAPHPDAPAASPLLSWESVVTEDYFTRVCAASQCNTFGVYTRENRQVAFGAYPEASFFNHSCLPNLCRVMRKGARAAVFYALRPIQAGEPLTICYTDVEESSTAERRRNLLEAYRFFCECERCSGAVTANTAAASADAATAQERPAEGSCRSSPFGAARGAEEEARGAKGCPVFLCRECPIRGYLRPIGPTDLVNHNPPAAWGWNAVVERQCTMCGKRYPLHRLAS